MPVGVSLVSILVSMACVLPPDLTIDDADAGLDSPPVIVEAHDTALNSLRPPATLTVNRASTGEIGLTLYDLDLSDDLYVQLFVDYDPANPIDANVNCFAPATPDTPSVTRTTACTTMGLCLAGSVGTPHRLEIEVYDRRPLDNTPYRTPGTGGLFSTWTLDLACIDEPL